MAGIIPPAHSIHWFMRNYSIKTIQEPSWHWFILWRVQTKTIACHFCCRGHSTNTNTSYMHQKSLTAGLTLMLAHETSTEGSGLLRGCSFTAQETPEFASFQMFLLQLLGKTKTDLESEQFKMSSESLCRIFLRRNIRGAFALTSGRNKWDKNTFIWKCSFLWVSLNILSNGQLIFFQSTMKNKL